MKTKITCIFLIFMYKYLDAWYDLIRFILMDKGWFCKTDGSYAFNIFQFLLENAKEVQKIDRFLVFLPLNGFVI